MRHYFLLFCFAFAFAINPVAAQHDEQENEHAEAQDGHGEEEKFNVSEMLMHHIMDSHDWHITDIPAGTDENGKAKFIPVALHLPWMFWSSRDGIVFASGTEDLIEKGYVPHHEHVYALKPGANVQVGHHGEIHLTDDELKGITAAEGTVSIFDFSITKTVLQMILIAILLMIVFRAVAKGYAKNAGKAPSGLQSFFEPIIIFIRDDVAKPYLGEKHYMRFMPYLLSLFFFIWFANLLGLTPFNSNIAGNISVTAALAILTFVITQINGTKDYWQHIFAMPGVPKWALAIVTPVEFLGLFTKPFALAVRLFANISAGHFMVLGLVSLLFIFGKTGDSIGGFALAMPLSIGFTLGIFCLEIIVGIIQAYVFTLLTAVFVGQALETHDHDDHHH